jgi:hypothetical protein
MRLGEEILSVEAMMIAERPWDQLFHIPSKDLFPLISELPLGLGVNGGQSCHPDLLQPLHLEPRPAELETNVLLLKPSRSLAPGFS